MMLGYLLHLPSDLLSTASSGKLIGAELLEMAIKMTSYNVNTYFATSYISEILGLEKRASILNKKFSLISALNLYFFSALNENSYNVNGSLF